MAMHTGDTMIDPIMTFDKTSIKEILYFFDKSVDNEGFVIDLNNKRVLAMDGMEIKASDIAGIVNVGGMEKLVRVPSGWDVVD
jgi:hypothetical protein